MALSSTCHLACNLSLQRKYNPRNKSCTPLKTGLRLGPVPICSGVPRGSSAGAFIAPAPAVPPFALSRGDVCGQCLFSHQPFTQPHRSCHFVSLGGIPSTCRRINLKPELNPILSEHTTHLSTGTRINSHRLRKKSILPFSIVKPQFSSILKAL